MIWPLRHAQASYVLGNYLGTTGLCGSVAEMLAILLYDLEALDVQEHLSETIGEPVLSGVAFENLDQSRREKILRARGLIPSACYGHFAKIREHRRRYLHYFSRAHEGIAADAGEAFRLTVELTAAVIGQTVHGGAVRLRSNLVKYLAQHGQISRQEARQ